MAREAFNFVIADIRVFLQGYNKAKDYDLIIQEAKDRYRRAKKLKEYNQLQAANRNFSSSAT
jgi:hypothetical protein